ncbi:Protein of unknown function [Cotesia congregata]|uniref:Uncharacterized protein n=1 Tax=Cotesia congregata TaxID=51543 RepID=A0A8J2HLE9_COTCN|nr:Protein of unknown function [Cotesia congregata]
MDNQSVKRKRGPYKRYLYHGSTEKIPKRTLNYWKAQETARLLHTSSDSDEPVTAVNEVSSKDEISDIVRNLTIVVDNTSNEIELDPDQPAINLDRNDEEICFSSYDESSDESAGSSDENSDSNGLLCNEFYRYVSDEDEEEETDIAEEANYERLSSETYVCDKYPIQVLIRTLFVLAFKLKFNVTNEAAENVIKLTEALNGERSGFTSLYHLKKIINYHSIPIEIHHLCLNCCSYIGEESVLKTSANSNDGVEKTIKCSNCEVHVNIKENHNSRNIFMYLSLTEQLKEFFGRYSDSLLCETPRKKLCSYAVEDIFDGKLFKAPLPEENYESSISLNFSVDGAPLFKSSNTSIIPIVFTINELQVRFRKQHILLCSEIKPKGRGHVRVYPIDNDGNAFGEGSRSHAETLQHALTGDKGIKRRSNLCDIPNFHIIHHLDVDWKHCVPLGVCRQFANLWFDSKNHDKEFYFNAFLPEIDDYLMTIKPSKDISRTPRKMSESA